MSNTTFLNIVKPESGKEITFDGADLVANNVKVNETPATDDSLITKSYFESNKGVGQINTLLGQSSYEIQNSDLTNYSKLIIYADPQTGNQIYTMPPLSENQGKIVRVQTRTLGGKVTVRGQSGTTIGGCGSLALQSENNYLKVIAGREWEILGYNAFYDTGWINTNDWTNHGTGTSAFDYDTRSNGGADHFISGEVVVESTSGNTGIIQSDTDAASSGTLYLKNVTGTGIWTNNRTITGLVSGTTALVNEGSGSNKNQSTYVYHNFGALSSELKITTFVSTTASMVGANKYLHTGGTYGGVGRGLGNININENNVQVWTNSSGIMFNSPDTSSNNLTSQNYYYRVTAEIKI